MVKKDRKSIIEDILSYIETNIHNAATPHEAIILASYYGLFATRNFISLYDGGNLEETFIERFEDDFPWSTSVPHKDSIHVISTTYLAGGHTRLMERLASMHDSLPDLLITCQSNVEYNKEDQTPLFASIFDISDLELSDRLSKLISIYSEYKNVILHIHPNDFIAAVAVRIAKRNKGIKFYFVNHADHLFSFGRTAADCVLEVSAFGEALGEIRCPGLTSSFIGIPLAANWEHINFTNPSGERKKILASGSFWKFKPGLGYSLPPILQEILKGNENLKLDVLGIRPFQDYWWWFIKLRNPIRVKLRRLVSYKKYKKILNESSFFFDSFPVTGGTAFPEAIINGQLAIGMNGPVCGYTPADELRVSDVQSIKGIISDPIDYIDKIRNSLMHMEVIHGMQYVRERYLSILAGRISENLLLRNFNGDPLFFESCADEFGKVNFPSFNRKKEKSELTLELLISLKFFRHISFYEIPKEILNLFQLFFTYLGRIKKLKRLP